MGRSLSITGYVSNGVGYASKKVILSSSTVNPRCIVHHRFPKQGDTIVYNTRDCTRLEDSAAGTFTLDSSGVATITGAEGSFGVDYGTYACTVTFNGTSEVVNVSHYDDTAARALFNFPSQDANGFSDFSSGPSSTDRLIYVDPTLGNDATYGPSGTGMDHYTWGSPPTGGWEEPSSVNAFASFETAFTHLRDGTGDRILTKRGETIAPAATISFASISGASTSRRLMMMPYGASSGARPLITPADAHADNGSIIYIPDEANIGVIGYDIYPTFRDPDHGDFAGWAANLVQQGIYILGTCSGIIIEDCRVRFCEGGINIQTSGNQNLSDIIIRRNVIDWNYSPTDSKSGLSSGSDTAGVTFEHYIGENVFDHNGWYRQAVSLSDTATSGNTTTATKTGAFAGYTLDGITINDTTNGGSTLIVSNTDDTVTFTAAANVDFTGGGAFTIGNDLSGGQASLLNHNTYTNQMQNSFDEKNVYLRASSIAAKITSTSFAGDQHPLRDYIQVQNFLLNNELGLGGGGNTRTGDTRFQDIRCMDNVDTGDGTVNPTSRGLKWGYTADDWNRGCIANNIFLKAGSSSPDIGNVWGLSMAGRCANTRISANKIIDVGKASGQTKVNAGSFIVDDSNATPDFSGCYFQANELQQKNTDGAVIGNWFSAETANVTTSSNHYYASSGDTDTYVIDDSAGTYTAYQTETGETGETNSEKNYLDEGASVANYQRKRGGTATEAAFITAQVARRKGSWDSTLKAEEVVAYYQDALSARPDIKFETAQFLLASATAPTTQTVTLSTGFGTPVGIILIQTGSRDLGPGHPDAYANCSFCVGFSDGTNDVCVHTHHDSETSNQTCYRAQLGSYCSYRVQGALLESAISVSSFGTDQVVLSIDYDVTDAFECFMIAITGDDIESINVGTHDDLGTGTSAIPITTGNRPDLFFAVTSNDSYQHDPAGLQKDTDANISFGFAINDGSETQACMAWSSPDSVDPEDNTIALYNDAILANVADGGVETYSVALNSFTSNGVIVTPSASTSSCIFQYMSISFKKRVKMALVDTTIPTSGNISITSPGFKPGFAFWFNFMGLAAYNTPEDASFSFGMTIMDGTTTYTSNNKALVGVTNADANGYGASWDELTLMELAVGEAIDVLSSADAFTDAGIDITMSNWPASSIKGRMLLLGVN